MGKTGKVIELSDEGSQSNSGNTITATPSVVENINNPQSLKVFDKSYNLIKEIKAPEQLTGFEYEVDEVCRAINNGEIQCESMSHERILYMMNLMDSIRAQMGIKYPFE